MPDLLPAVDIEELKSICGSTRYFYLASPYTKYHGGWEVAFQEACKVAAQLIEQGVGIFCPIAHSHPISLHGGINPASHDVWLPADKPLMRAACGLIVVMMPGWNESYGISVEIQEFTENQKPVRYMRWMPR